MTVRKGKGPGRIPKKAQPQRISLKTAIAYTQRYRKAAPASEHSGFFFAEGLRELLEQPGVHGMRIYHGLDENCAYRMVLVGVDIEGNDIVRVSRPRSLARAAGDSEAIILDQNWPCPPFCPRGSPLN